MTTIIDVQTGEVRACRKRAILRSGAIGSCVVIAAYDSRKKIGALAHVMLPGKAPSKAVLPQRTRYAADAVNEMITRMIWRGADPADVEATLVGGANVLRKKKDTICQNNLESTIKLLNRKQIPIRAQAVGGYSRRSVSLDVEKGTVVYNEGNRAQKVLWEFVNGKNGGQGR